MRVVSREGCKWCIGVGALVLRADGKISGRNAGGVVHRESTCGITSARIQAGLGGTCGWLGAGGFVVGLVGFVVSTAGSVVSLVRKLFKEGVVVARALWLEGWEVWVYVGCSCWL